MHGGNLRILQRRPDGSRVLFTAGGQ
jgi:hypothetical protein